MDSYTDFLPNYRAYWCIGKVLVFHSEVLVSNLGCDIGCPDWGSSWNSSVFAGIYQCSILIRPQWLPSKAFRIHHSLDILPFDAILSSYWGRRKTTRTKRDSSSPTSSSLYRFILISSCSLYSVIKLPENKQTQFPLTALKGIGFPLSAKFQFSVWILWFSPSSLGLKI
jgi:hypothetical protein